MKKFLIIISLIFLGFASAFFIFPLVFKGEVAKPMGDLPSAQAAAPREGLVGWWTMDTNDINGTTYYDKSGKNNNITSNGSPPQTTGKIKQALNLQGNPQYASASSAPFNFSTGNFTASVWIKSNNAAATYSILDKYNSNVADDRGWFIFEAGDVIKASIDNGSIDITGTASIQNGIWYHVVLVRNGNNAYTYVNGVQDGTVAGISARSASSAALLYIGVEKGTSQFFNGSLDDVRVYNRALSATEVAQLYSSAKTAYTKSAPMASSTTSGSVGQLVGWWTMDANDMSTTGATMYDKSGKNNNGTVTGTTTSTGRIGQARSFNGTSDVVTAADNASLRFGAGNFTLSAWIKTSNTNDRNIIDKYAATGGGGQYSLQINANTLRCWTWNGVYGPVKAGNTTITDNKWHHVLCSVSSDGTTVTVYVDGVADGSNTATAKNSDSDSTFKIGSNSTPTYFNGKIDDVRVYNYALSAQEVTQLYAAAKKNYTASAPMDGLVGWWTMDSNDMSTTGATLYDKSGQNNHGTVTGTTTSTGRIGQSRTFNGTSNQIQTNSFTLSIYPMTISGWVKPNDISSAQGIATYGDSSGAGQENGIIMASGQFWAISQNNAHYEATLTIPSAGRWYNVVGVFTSATSRKLYIDGVFQNENTTSITPTPTSPTVKIGNRTATNQYLNGVVDDVRIYNRALSAQEVANLYNSAKKAYIR